MTFLKPNVLHYGLFPHDRSLLATFGHYFLGIGGLERRIYCQIATLYIQKILSRRDEVRVNARSFAKRLKVRNEKIKWRRKNDLINRRETERNPAIIDVSHRVISKWLFFCYSSCLPLWLAQLARWLLHSAANLWNLSCSKYIFTEIETVFPE